MKIVRGWEDRLFEWVSARPLLAVGMVVMLMACAVVSAWAFGI